MKTTIIAGENMNQITTRAVDLVLDNGRVQSSRNGPVTCLNNVMVELTDPKNRHLYLDGRKNNLYATMAELFWVMSGADKIDPFLSFFLPRAKDYSDDGRTWRGAYGPRIYMYNQLQNAIDVFNTDGPDTRRSVISVYDAGTDSGVQSKDIPCNNLIHFFMEEERMLSMNVVSRSSDLIWGLFGINIPEWTFLQEYVAQMVGKPLGRYHHFTTNLHIYDSTKSQADSIYDNPQYQRSHHNYPSVFPEGDVKQFFQELIETWNLLITDKIDHIQSIDSVLLTFIKYGVPREHNTLYHYADLITAYIASKRGVYNSVFSSEDRCDLSDDIHLAMDMAPELGNKQGN
jgi:hypothetical protein